MFDIHKVKPVHGWREFIGEVGIIVLGVLIALGFEQVVEWAHWRQKVGETTEALRDMAAEVAANAAEQQVVEPCVDRQLSDLQQRLIAPGPYKPAPSYEEDNEIFTVRLPTRNWPDGVWRTASAEGVTSHFPQEQRHQLETVFASVEGERENARQADAQSWRLASLALPIQDATARARMVQEIAELRGRSALLGLVAAQTLGYLKQANMMPPSTQLQEFLRRGSGTVTFCRNHHLPLGKLHPVEI